MHNKEGGPPIGPPGHNNMRGLQLPGPKLEIPNFGPSGQAVNQRPRHPHQVGCGIFQILDSAYLLLVFPNLFLAP